MLPLPCDLSAFVNGLFCHHFLYLISNIVCFVDCSWRNARKKNQEKCAAFEEDERKKTGDLHTYLTFVAFKQTTYINNYILL